MENEQPNPADFSVDDKPGKYEVVIQVEGKIRKLIDAESQDAADDQAEKMADDIAEDRLCGELDEIYDVAVEYCRRPKPMFRVTRNGKPYQVSRLQPGDLPREPDERGF